jgi:aryl-alcohol dehydrogenase-like predicted oxidoreductase
MKYRKFGKTGWDVSTLMLGTMQFGGEWGPQADNDSIATINTALDSGINFIDTADFYGKGKAEEIVGKAVAGRRENVYIATKFGYDLDNGGERNLSPAYARRAVEASLRRLGTDYIDLYQAHNAPADVAASDDFFEEMQKLVDEGKIRAIGTTVGPGDFGAWEAISTAKHPQAGSVMIAYHLLSQNPARVVFPYLRSQGVGVIARGPLAMGLLSGTMDEETQFGEDDARRYWDRDFYLLRLQQARAFSFLIEEPVKTPAEAALRFALSNEDVSTVLVGMQNADQVAENVRVAEMEPLNVEQLQRVAETYDSFSVHEQPIPEAIKR